VLAASSLWSTAEEPKDWTEIARTAMPGAPLPAAVDYATTALENAWIVSGCTRSEVGRLRDELRWRGEPLPPEMAARLDALSDDRHCRDILLARRRPR